MDHNHHHWRSFALKVGLKLEAHELVFVRGWVKTSDWLVAVSMEVEKGKKISGKIRGGTYASASLKAVTTKHEGPYAWTMNHRISPDKYKHDQCIFLKVLLPSESALASAVVSYVHRVVSQSRIILRPT